MRWMFLFLPCVVFGGLEVSPSYYRVEVGDTVFREEPRDIFAVGASVSFPLGEGYVARPFVVGGSGFYRGGVAIVCEVSVFKDVSLVPAVGYRYTYASSTMQCGFGSVGLAVTSHCPLLGLDVVYRGLPCWELSAGLQHGWSRLAMKYEGFPSMVFSTKGWNGSLRVGRRLSNLWSMALVYGYEGALWCDGRGLRLHCVQLATIYRF